MNGSSSKFVGCKLHCKVPMILFKSEEDPKLTVIDFTNMLEPEIELIVDVGIYEDY